MYVPGKCAHLFAACHFAPPHLLQVSSASPQPIYHAILHEYFLAGLKGEHMIKILSFALLVIAQTSYANESYSAHVKGDALILSPKVFVINEDKLARPFEFLQKIFNDTVIATLSWTDNTGNKRAKIEIVNVTYNDEKNNMIFETKQWLPYTLSGEVVTLPVLLKNAKIKFL